MKSIRKRRNEYVLIFVISIGITVWLSMTSNLEFSFLVGVTSILSFLLLVKQIRLLHDAMLIWDNLILSVPLDIFSELNHRLNIDSGETVISTFGVLIGCEIYKWGLEGIDGVRLLSAQFDLEKIYLTFGDEAQTMQVELIHGIHRKQAIEEAVQKLWHETGVKAKICDW